MSMAHYQLARLFESLFRAIKFKLPTGRMARDLEDKSNYFLSAQASFLNAVRYHHPKYAVAAGFALGAIYEQFYRDLMDAEIPNTLSKSDIKVYFGELKKKIRPLVEKALRVYERNLKLAKRLGRNEAWRIKTQGQLARLRALFKRDFSGLDKVSAAPKPTKKKKRKKRTRKRRK